MDCSPPGSSVHGILQARILKWVVILSSRGSSQPRDQTTSHVSCIGRWFFTTSAAWEAPCVCLCSVFCSELVIARRNINNLKYADDTTLMAESEEELKSLLMKVQVES